MKDLSIQLRDVHRSYMLGKTEVQALRGITLDIEKGSFSSFIGPSGCGKTTTLNIIGCIDAPSSGRIHVNNEDMALMNDNQRTSFRGRNIGFIFQNFNLVPVLNILENVAYPLHLMQVPPKEIKERSEAMMEYVGIAPWAKHKPNELSGGQRQRTAIARALVIEPQIIVADEPTANLDSKTSDVIMSLMKEMQQRLQTTFIFATHDPRYMDYVECIFEMKDGIIIEQRKNT